MVKKEKTGMQKNPAAKEALERFKYEIAHEIGVSYDTKKHRKAALSGESSTVGNYMVNKMIAAQEEKM